MGSGYRFHAFRNVSAINLLLSGSPGIITVFAISFMSAELCAVAIVVSPLSF